MSPGPPPTTEAPPPLLALTRDFSASLAGSIASQVSCAELEPRSSRKPRAQRTFLPQLPIPRLVAGFPSARVTSAGWGEEARGVKRGGGIAWVGPERGTELCLQQAWSSTQGLWDLVPSASTYALGAGWSPGYF